MLTGGRADVAESVGSMLGVTEVHTAPSPAVKFAVIWGVRADGKATMVGDGVSDAPAFATTDIDVAMGVRGIAVSSKAANIVLLVDRLDRFVDAARIAHRTCSAALRSVMIGMPLLPAVMVAAALGHLPPLAGATLRELINVLAITSALRVLLPTSDEATRLLVCADVKYLKAEHAELEPILNRIHLVAGALPHMGGSAARDAPLSLNQFLVDALVPHERRDDTQLYPDVTCLLGGDGPMVVMSAMHRGAFYVMSLLGRIVTGVSADGLDAVVMQEPQRLLYGLNAILRPHYVQEDELFHVLGGEA